ncbi:MAG: hypothetical protein WA347_08715 [Rhabdochlamydiaceae bacterium]|jgi:hypothetical protein
MKWNNTVSCIIGVLTMSFCFAQNDNLFSANEDCLQEKIENSKADKIYVHLNQLVIDEKGIFLSFSDDLLPVSAIFHDNVGFYVMTNQLEDDNTSYECPNGHPSRHGDGRCNQKKCPYFRG